jgi:hypothetical protein
VGAPVRRGWSVPIKITVVVPTVSGREADLMRCLEAYRSRSIYDVELMTYLNLPTCADGWNLGAGQATGDYLHFSADDLEPHEGWDVAAVEACESHALPAPRIVNAATGNLDSCGSSPIELPDWTHVTYSVIPFMPTNLWERIGPVPSIHYYSDNYVSWMAERAGWPTVVRRGFAFTHHWAQPGRGAGMSSELRMSVDNAAFEQAKAAILSSE